MPTIYLGGILLTKSIEITLIASKKMGILPVLMRKLGSLGLIYRRCITDDYDDGVKLTILCVGDLNSDKEHLVDTLKSIPNVVSIVGITEAQAGPNDVVESLPTRFDMSRTELQPLRANDIITHDIIHIVEDRLSEAFGPVASILLKKAAKKSKLVGELFLNLAEDLTDDQKVLFLRNVEGLEQIPVNP